MKKLNISSEVFQPFIAQIERLSKIQRLLICLGTIFLILGAFIWFSAYPKYEKISKLGDEIKALDTKLASMKIEAAKLPQYRQKLEDSKAQFALVKKALPEKKDIPELLTSISQAGHDAGLEFLLFQPEKEVQKDFYAEIPVSITVNGGYHNLAQFLSRVASMPRVVNMQNLVLRPGGNPAELKTNCTAVTYRFVDKPAQAPKGKAQPTKKK